MLYLAYGNEKYIACMSRDTLEYYKEDNFSFLEKSVPSIRSTASP